MLKTLKSKFSSVYLCLVLITAVVGISSVINIYMLSKSIDGLMTDNYKSINVVSYMLETLEGQNNSVLIYMNVDKQQGIDLFHNQSDNFYRWYNIESNNVTEKGERELVQDINKNYIDYLKLFSRLQEIANSNNDKNAVDFYNSDIVTKYNQLKKLLRDLALLNEKAMFNSKNRVTNDANKSMYLIIALSLLSVAGGYLLSRISLNRFLSPLYALRENMKAVKEGDLNQHTNIVSEDEIGELSKEFNNMTNRLRLFEESTMGRLLAEKNKSLAIVKSIKDPIIVLDINYKIALVNDGFEEFFNIEEKDVMNKYFLEIVANGELYDYIKSIYNSQEEKSKSKIIYLNSNNKDYYFNIVVTLLKDYEGKSSGMVVLFQNVTELKQIEKIKSEFIATVSHEFKTPLTSIMIGASLIGDGNIGNLNKKQEEILETINEDSEKLLNLVNDLLKLSKVESNKSIFKIEPSSINEIIEYSIKGFYEQLRNKDIKLHYDIDKNLPKVNVDFEKITWVLNNLISNALKFTKQGDELYVDAFVKNGEMCVLVKDTGIGIPEDYQEKIFEKFVQIEGTESESKGTGLGLSIAKEIIEANGGEIWCESKLGEGSTFTFTLPTYK